MKASKKIKIITYNCTVTFIVTDDIHSELKKIYKAHNIDEEIDAEAEGLLVTADISTYYLLVDVEFLTHNTIAHEIFHVVKKMTESREIFEEEAQAWIAGHIANDIYKFLDKKKFKVSCE
jgi:hypothetical protein